MMKKILLFTILIALVNQSYAQVLTKVGGINLGGEGAAEIIAIDKNNNRLWVLNNPSQSVVVYDINNPSAPDSITSISFTNYGAGVNSIAIYNGIVALAVENEVKQLAGKAVFFDANSYAYVGDVATGALPDMCVFTNNGEMLLVANEGEPNNDFTVDPEGSVTIVEGIKSKTFVATQVSFSSLTSPTLADGYKFASPAGTSFAQDIEPEYIAVNGDDTRAYVTCQENNGMVVIDLVNKSAMAVYGLGTKDYSLEGNGFDASDKTENINITTHPVKGLYQPDAVVYMEGGYILTANEGDARDYDGYSEEDRVKDLTLDPTIFPNAADLQTDENIGRLKITNAIGDLDNDNDYDEIYAYGGRSFSIFDTTGTLVFDSGDEFEQTVARLYPIYFNGELDGNEFPAKVRSDDKGPEPEGIALADFGDTKLAFIGLERFGGIMVYDVSNPSSPSFIQYINTFDFGTLEGDVSPEGLTFQKLTETTGLLVASFEVSGTVALFSVEAPVSVKEYLPSPSLYPNPSNNGVFYLENKLSGSVVSTSGKVLKQFRNTSVVDLSSFQSGVYVLMIPNHKSTLLLRN